MGLSQKGRSRVWLDDHVWWVGVVEFQPSGFSKGSYLNVGCVWLWHVQPHIAFGQSTRIGRVHSFQSEEQFRPVAEDLAQKAAQEIFRLRNLFLTIAAVRDYFERTTDGAGLWQWFDAAVACALSGRPEHARELFKKVVSVKEDRDWVKEAQSDARQLSALIFRPEQFHETIVERIRKSRELQKLCPAADVAF